MNQAIREPLNSKGENQALYSPGLEGVIAGESALCLVDEGAAGLRYRGYAIGDLAEWSSFEEVAHLLLFGHLPSKNELADFTTMLAANGFLPGPVEHWLKTVRPDMHPMDILRTGISLLGLSDPEAQEGSREANLRKSVRLLSQIPLLIAHAYHVPMGRQPASPTATQGFAHNLLDLVAERKDDALVDAMVRVLNVSLILYAEHEFNASTFAARVVASSLADLHGAVTAAVASLKGPLHGGANEAVASMMVEIGRPERAEPWVRNALARKQRIMGFGHRVLKREIPGRRSSSGMRKHSATHVAINDGLRLHRPSIGSSEKRRASIPISISTRRFPICSWRFPPPCIPRFLCARALPGGARM